MNPQTFGGVTLSKHSDGSPVAFVISYTTATQTMAIQPTSALLPETAYDLTVPATPKDNFGYTLKASYSVSFVTGDNPSQTVAVISPYDTSGANPLTVNNGVFSSGAYVVLRTAFKAPLGTVSALTSSVNSAVSSNVNMRELNRVEVLISASGNGVFGNAPAPVKLTLSSQSSGAGAPAVPMNAVDPSTLMIYQYVAGKGLVAVPGSVNNGNGTASAMINQSGVYILGGAISTTLSSAFAWPVPFKPSASHTVITFSNLSPDSTIKIYTIMGELVQQLTGADAQGNHQWPVTNKDGDKVASGVYIYQIKNSFNEKRGKLVIIR
jgi:hypothetical protein